MRSTDKGTTYRYTFKRHVDIDDVQDSLTLAVLSAEELHGRAQVRLDASFHLDRQRRTCAIDASTPVGQDIAKLFTGYLSREFGERSYSLNPSPAAGGRGGWPRRATPVRGKKRGR